MNSDFMLGAFAGLAILFAALFYWTDRVRRQAAVYRWAANNGLKLLSFRQPILTEASAFPMSLSKSQQVFQVHVEVDGERKWGWVRLGSAWLGLASRKADVIWDLRT